jgi:Tfp pilus assembly protein PilN
MRKQKRVNLNLATNPLRNRRLFFLLFGILGVLIVVISSVGGYTYWKYGSKNKTFLDQNALIERMIHEANREEKKLSTQIAYASQSYQRKVDLLNTLILKKSFSWVGFLSALEEALPSSCYIESLAPNLKDTNQMEVRFKVAAPSLDELLKLNKNLYEMRFTGIRIISESINEAGLLIAEITLVYERTV